MTKNRPETLDFDMYFETQIETKNHFVEKSQETLGVKKVIDLESLNLQANDVCQQFEFLLHYVDAISAFFFFCPELIYSEEALSDRLDIA